MPVANAQAPLCDGESELCYVLTLADHNELLGRFAVARDVLTDSLALTLHDALTALVGEGACVTDDALAARAHLRPEAIETLRDTYFDPDLRTLRNRLVDLRARRAVALLAVALDYSAHDLSTPLAETLPRVAGLLDPLVAAVAR